MTTPRIEKLWNKYCHEGDENTPDRMFYENFVDAITEAKAEEWQKAIDLADKIESQYTNTEFNEWRAFKGFRNALNDKLQDNQPLL